MRTFCAVGVLLSVAVCGLAASDARAEGQMDSSLALAPYRFEVVTDDPIEHGERLSAVLGCIGCHKLDLAGEDWTDPELGVLWTANLTHSAAAYSESELTEMITEGRRPDRALIDMPSYLFSELHPDDLAALVRYLKTLPVTGEKHPEPTIGPQLARDIASGEFKDSVQRVAEMKNQAPPDLGPEHELGRFILRATCAECHGMDLRGSTEEITDAPPRPNLRMVLAYSAEDFSKLMTTGKALGDRELELMSGVARWRYSHFTEREIQVVYDYLVALARHDP